MNKRKNNYRRYSKDIYDIQDNEKVKNLNDGRALAVSIIAVVVSVIAILITGYAAYRDYIAPGKLKVYQPTGFCIVRGYKDIGFPSDHLVIPLVIENTGKGAKTLQVPTFHLKDNNSDLESVYTMVGTVPDLYRTTLDVSYQVGFSVSVPENSVREYYLAFHIEDWWDKTKPEYYEYHFIGGQEWHATLTYQVNGMEEKWRDESSNENLFTMPIYETIDRLKYGESYNADCFPTIH